MFSGQYPRFVVDHQLAEREKIRYVHSSRVIYSILLACSR